jgi:hypothetical protein
MTRLGQRQASRNSHLLFIGISSAMALLVATISALGFRKHDEGRGSIGLAICRVTGQ